MNGRQRVVMWVGIAVIVGMGLYPPWVDTLDYEGLHFEWPGPYSWLWEPPAARKTFDINVFPNRELETRMYATGIHIDMARLLIQWACVGLVAAGLVVSLKRRDDP